MNAWSPFLNELSGVMRPATEATTLPPSCYTDPDILEMELQCILDRGWIVVGRSDQLNHPGDYITLELDGHPLVILRNQQGVLRAFANSCRHRGSVLVEGAGNLRRLRCPFHSWSYDLDGQLTFCPRMERAAGFDKSQYGLHGYPVEEYLGFVFIALSGGCDPLDEWLGDFGQLHEPWQLENWVTTRVRNFEVACNWKAYIEVFNEYYHLPYVHPNTLSSFYPDPDPIDHVTGNFVSQFGRTEGNAALLPGQSSSLPVLSGLDSPQRDGIRYTWMFPNLTFAAASDCLWIYRALPAGVNRCQVMQMVAFPQSSTELPEFEELAAHYYHRVDKAIAEDIPFLEKQQRGLASRFAKAGRYADLEPSVANFGSWYASRMTRYLESSHDRA